MNTVYSLRQEGWKVRCLHFRVSNKNNLTPRQLSRNIISSLVPAYNADTTKLHTHGGLTIVQLRSPQGVESQGLSLCSLKDPYNRKLGTKIALNRAMSNITQGTVPDADNELIKGLGLVLTPVTVQ